MEADSSEKLVIEDRRGVGNFQVNSLSFKIKVAPYLSTDKIKVDVLSMNLKFDKESTMSLRTGSSSDNMLANKKESAAFKETIGYLGPMIKEQMRKQIHSELTTRLATASKNAAYSYFRLL